MCRECGAWVHLLLGEWNERWQQDSVGAAEPELGGRPSRLAQSDALTPFPVRHGPSDPSGSCSAKQAGKPEALIPVRVIFSLKISLHPFVLISVDTDDFKYHSSPLNKRWPSFARSEVAAPEDHSVTAFRCVVLLYKFCLF